MTYTVNTYLPFPMTPQLDPDTANNQDHQPSENCLTNCGEAVVCSVLEYYGVVRPDGTVYTPDDLKDWRFQQGAAGVLSTTEDLMSMLAHFGQIPAMSLHPAPVRNGANGLLDLEWQNLSGRVPVIVLMQWIDSAGTVHPGIGHWRVVYEQTESAVTSMDPQTGHPRTESWADHCGRFLGTAIIPTVPPTI